jgi:hypothetical protein
MYADATAVPDDGTYISSLAGVYGYSTDYNMTINTEIYDAKNSVTALLESRYGSSYSIKSRSDTTIKIDNADVRGTIYEVSMPIYTFAADSTDALIVGPCPDDGCQTVEKVVVVEHANQVFFIIADEQTRASQLEFYTLLTANPDDMTELREILLKQAGFESIPVSAVSNVVEPQI